MENYDVVVIGAGSAGYVAAIRCAQLGFKTACVDQWIGKQGKPTLGGTCLNVGCIPSKALLESSDHYQNLLASTQAHGIRVEKVEIDIPAMIQRKDEIVKGLTSGIEGLFKKHGVTWLQGRGTMRQPMQVVVTDNDGTETTVKAAHIILATGSLPREVPNVPMDGEVIVDSSAALDFEEAPKRLGIIGAGVIGVELGSVWGRLGSNVVLIEAMDRFLAFVDEKIAQEAQKTFTEQGLDIRLGSRVLSAERKGDTAVVRYEDSQGNAQEMTFDKLIVAVGRTPNLKGLGTAEMGVQADERGYIQVDAFCRTSIPQIFAIGDVVRGPMLAHKGSEEGIMVAERLAGQKTTLNYNNIPWVIYTQPEIAWVGKTERELKAEAREYNVGWFPLTANGRARAMHATAGSVKVLADKQTDALLGVHIFAPTASEMIAEAVVAMEFGGSAEDLARIVHAHPTLSEAVHEAALAVSGRQLHL